MQSKKDESILTHGANKRETLLIMASVMAITLVDVVGMMDSCVLLGAGRRSFPNKFPKS
jgi:hypothetical protein